MEEWWGLFSVVGGKGSAKADVAEFFNGDSRSETPLEGLLACWAACVAATTAATARGAILTR